MKSFFTVFTVLCDAAIAAILVWKHTDLFNLTVPVAFMVVSPVLLFLQFAALKREGVPKDAALALGWLTGPCVLLGLSLVLGLNHELKAVRMVGGRTKEMRQAANDAGISEKCIDQWTSDTIRRMESERALFLLLTLSMCLLYASRVRATSSEHRAKRTNKSASLG